jgi:hypothetical protein
LISDTNDHLSLFLTLICRTKIQTEIGLLYSINLALDYPIGLAYLDWISSALIWFIVHPLLLPPFEKLQSDYNLNFKIGQYNIFELFGSIQLEKSGKLFFSF